MTTWNDQVLAHEKRIRRHSLIAGIVIGVFLTFVGMWLMDFVVTTASRP